jgi:hypothetical protein
MLGMYSIGMYTICMLGMYSMYSIGFVLIMPIGLNEPKLAGSCPEVKNK